MTDKTLCLTPDSCGSLLGKDGIGCGHQVLYGVGACWRRDGRPERKAGLQDNDSPFAGEGEEE